MRAALIIILVSIYSIAFSQEEMLIYIDSPQQESYITLEEARLVAKNEEKPLLIYTGKNGSLIQDLFINDTLSTLIEKEFIPLYHINGKDRKHLKKEYNLPNNSFILFNHDETVVTKFPLMTSSAVLQEVIPYTNKTYHYYTDEYKQEFIKTDSTKIHATINSVYEKTSRKHTRQLTIDYLKNQDNLLSPTNYQLVKTLMPFGDKELLTQFISQLKPEMYTQEMAEKIAYELLITNNFSIEKTRAQVIEYNIPFQEEVGLYLDVAASSTFRAKKENCLDFVLKGTTHDYETLRNCFSYILHNGSIKQLKEVEQKYMFSLNEVRVDRSILYAELLSELYLSQGDHKKFIILQKRNEIIREKFLSPRSR